MNFNELYIKEELKRAAADMGFEACSPIQERAIPEQLAGRDIIGQAQTGTGKTAAFAIPILEEIDPEDRSLQAVILCPTRELAIQVALEIRKLARYLHGVKTLPVYGGTDLAAQIRTLKSGTQIIVGTPGRVMDHMRRRTIRLDSVSHVVLDEADEMLDMGFIDDIRTILGEMPEDRRTALFSATLPPEIRKIAQDFLEDPVMVRVVRKELTVQKIEQRYCIVKQRSRTEALLRLLDLYRPKLSLVFCNTKREVDELAGELQAKGYLAEGLHGDLKQAQRDRVMQGFRGGATQILIATDVAARGIDVDDVEIVFNYELPDDEEYYVHRIGRTGRAGKEGMAISFVSSRELNRLHEIERYCRAKIAEEKLPTSEDINRIRMERVLDEMSERIHKEDLRYYVELLDTWLAEEEVSSLTLAAAFLKAAVGERGEEPQDEKVSRLLKQDTGASEPGMVRLFISLGKKQRIRPGDLVGAIAGESGMPGKLIGSIDMYDSFSFVEVPAEYAEDVLSAMAKTTVKGKTFHIEPASEKR